MSGFTPPTMETIPTIPEMVKAMDRDVAGLPLVKARLAVALRRFMVGAITGLEHQPQNLLVVGPTGGGKTWLLKHLLSSIPIIWTDTSATEYSDVGYQGRDLTQMFLGLTAERWRDQGPGQRATDTKEHRRRAERFGVVLFDEFDKLRVREETSPFNKQAGDRQVGKILQYELLKLVEGTDTRVKPSDQSDGFDLKTDGVLYIAMGAFQGIEDIIARNHQGGDRRDDIHELMQLEDIIEYGFIPELVGRFATLIALPPLQIADLIRILREQIVPRWEMKAKADNLRFIIDAGGAHTVANEAKKHALGARSLEPILDEWTWRAFAAAQPGEAVVLDTDAANHKNARVERLDEAA